MARIPWTSGRKRRSPGGVPASSPATGDGSMVTAISTVAVRRVARGTPPLPLPDLRPPPDHSLRSKSPSRQGIRDDSLFSGAGGRSSRTGRRHSIALAGQVRRGHMVPLSSHRSSPRLPRRSAGGWPVSALRAGVAAVARRESATGTHDAGALHAPIDAAPSPSRNASQ